MEGDSLWREVIDRKYGFEWGRWCSKEGRGSYGVCLWKYIREGWNIFEKHIKFEVGVSDRIRFWFDDWCCERPLNAVFLVVLSLVGNQQVAVSEVLCRADGVVHRNVILTRNAQDWELDEIAGFFSFLHSVKLGANGRDCMLWKHSGSNKFSVNSFYKVLTAQQHISFPWKSIWKVCVPSKVAFFSWTAALGKILTIDNLRKCVMIVMEWCFMCKKNGESIDNLFLCCEVAREFLGGILCRAGLSWVMPKRVVEVLACWNRHHNSSQLDEAWRMIPLCLMWCLWTERNDRCFNNRKRAVGDIWNFFVSSLFQWFSAIVLKGECSLSFCFLFSFLECNLVSHLVYFL
ncbi:uncharacterized protein LOC122308443 isoform X1 [Carya illinoinensis]|uniref:uncharacterized protein LOC122308443 isoform X1 n=1 Tax=Carya illinoinensis TaxID=32201 RepID=UPI001C721E77|nr:uncharacterized protein LOC122308443 isoform X1 [Carya illinoinensis]XP_042977703.1 uncharacterized protein LOC122308443 isoform X1 [Carya illinoinensis]XP_042977704.1 uncharacterized protein LOC122308443 isoform X1 [Carya illinoinensis]